MNSANNLKEITMKKAIYLLTIMLAFCGLETAAQVTFSPAIFTAEDQVTLTVDVTGTPMAGLSEAYIWSFSNPTAGSGPQVDGIVNGTWGNSGAGAKMTAAGTNKWSFTFTGTTLFNLAPGQLKEFGFLVKAKDGSKQTPDYKPFKFDPLVFTPTEFRIFPSKVGQDDAVTINFDQSLSGGIDEQRLSPSTVTIVVYNQNNVPFGNPISLPVRSTGAKQWAATFIPTHSYALPPGTKLTKFRYKFNGTVPNASGVPTAFSTAEMEVQFLDLK
jgi:hypothetical protein